ncbi:hypothetical protein K438DRAFT_921902 [Mycena galopus ATCC 62051]|nr:hypothetical protein K438DRAFT_921902 [Mycena galopus ATCC 62051]
MDSENAPLLLNDENTANVAHADQSNAGRSQAGHLCSSCSGKMDPQKTTLRHVLIFAAFLWCIMIFSLLVAHMVIGERPNVITVFVTIWTHVTLAVLIVLLILVLFTGLPRRLLTFIQVAHGPPPLLPPQAGSHRHPNSRPVRTGFILAPFNGRGCHTASQFRRDVLPWRGLL